MLEIIKRSEKKSDSGEKLIIQDLLNQVPHVFISPSCSAIQRRCNYLH